MMEKHYVILVEFVGPLDGRRPLTQTLDVHSAGAEFSVLLHALNASPDIGSLRVCNKTKAGHLNIMTKDDLGLPDLEKIK